MKYLLILNAEQKELDEVALTPEGLAGMIKLITNGTISSKIAKKVFKELIENGGDAEKIVKEKGLVQISDEGALCKMGNRSDSKQSEICRGLQKWKTKSSWFFSWSNHESFKRTSKSANGE